MLGRDVKSLKRISFYLFLIPTIALIFSLIINNFLAEFNYTKPSKFSSISHNLKTVICDDSQECATWLSEPTKNYGDCYNNIVERIFVYKNENIKLSKIMEFISDESYDLNSLQKIELIESKKINTECIRNSNLFFLYNNFPTIVDGINKLKNHDKFQLGTNVSVNPFFYGETSISNIVKRFPLAFFFKSLMFISSLLMVIYWYLNNKVARQVQKVEKNFNFFIFGILSSLFLFFHVLFLGMNFENETFSTLRRIIIIFFILFEIISQVLLVLNLKRNFDIYNFIISERILFLKYCLISFMIIATIIILIILSFFDLTSSFDYFLEWNYFLILLFFYLLSSLLWKKEL